MATLNMLAVRPEPLICSWFFPGIAVSDTEESMVIGVLCLCGVYVADYATGFSPFRRSHTQCVCVQMCVI